MNDQGADKKRELTQDDIRQWIDECDDPARKRILRQYLAIVLPMDLAAREAE